MKLRKLIFLALFAEAVTLAGYSYAAELNDVIKGLEDSEKATQDIRLEFIQTINYTALKESHTITGELFFKKPGKLNYALKTPAKQYFISDGKKLWIYTPANNQVLIDYWKNWKGISYFIPGMFNPKGKVTDLKKYYDFKLKSEDETSYELYLKPKKKVALGFNLPEKFDFYLRLSKKDFSPIKSILESEDITSTTEITVYEKNLKIPDEKFIFKIPQGAEALNLFK